ncbi:MAG: hypothetical protein FD129_2521, partial [bacterium]
GSACVSDGGKGYLCPQKPGAAASCCLAKRARCKHGLWPEVGARPRGVTMETTDDCRLRVAARPDLNAVAERLTSGFLPTPPALPLPGLVLAPPAAFSPVWSAEFTLGYRPPPDLPSGAGRAPPSL